MEYYRVVKRKELLVYIVIWVGFEDSMLVTELGFRGYIFYDDFIYYFYGDKVIVMENRSIFVRGLLKG